MPWRHRERVDILLARDEMTPQQAVAADALNDSDYAKYKNAYVYGNLWDMLELNGGNWINTPVQFGDKPIDDEFVWPGGNDQHHVTGATHSSRARTARSCGARSSH
jgi:hypothetical protein